MTISEIPRAERMRRWMSEYDITDRSIAEVLGITRARVTIMLNQETMPAKHHKAFLQLGFPAELLPRPLDKKPGPRPKTARFPGLSAQEASHA